MPIEFQCPSCKAKIRTPDNSAGRSARCPKCSTVVTIPAAATQPPAPPPGFGASSPGFPPGFGAPPSNPLGGSPLGQPGPNPLGASANPLGAPASNPLGGPPPGSMPNPFAPKPAAPFSAPNLNPYAAPGPAFHQGFYQSPTRESVRSQLLGPGIGMIAGALIALAYVAITVVMMIVNPNLLGKVPDDPAERAGYWAGAGGVLVIGTIAYTLELVGGICLVMCRNRTLAMTGAIAGLIPCNVCCVVGFPFSIWALVVLNKPEVKAAFQQP